MKNELLIIFLIIAAAVFVIMPLYDNFLDINLCVDMGICKQGIKMKIDGELVEINEQNCKKYNKLWLDDIEACNVRK